MDHIIKIEKFEGPLDLLLQFIVAEELDISEVSLAQVTDQYVDYINNTELEPTEITDFLNIAARLLLIKSKLLLPFVDEMDDENELDLTKQLKMYSKFVEASKVINKLWRGDNNLYTREKLVYKIEGFNPPKNLGAKSLQASFAAAVSRIKPFIKLPEKTLKKVVSLREKIDHLAGMIKDKVSFHFHESFEERPERPELIVSFLALLELVKQRQVSVNQDDTFSNIMVEKLESNN